MSHYVLKLYQLVGKPHALCTFLGRVKVVCAYQGIPAPSGGRPVLTLDVDNVVDLLSNDDNYWWEVRQCKTTAKSIALLMSDS